MNRDQRTLPSNRPSTVKNYRTVAMLKLRYIAIVIFCLVVANYIYSFTTLATSKLSNSLRSVTTTTTTEDDNNDGYTPTWKEWYASLVGGGAIKYSRGSTLRTCVDDLPIPGVARVPFLNRPNIGRLNPLFNLMGHKMEHRMPMVFHDWSIFVHRVARAK